MRLERALLVDQRLGVIAIHADHGPVRLFAAEVFRVAPRGSALGDVREEVVARGRPLDGDHRELADAVRPWTIRRGDAHAQKARLDLGEIDPVAPAVAATHGVHAVPLRAVHRRLDRVARGGRSGRPVDRRAAVLARRAEVERKALRARALLARPRCRRSSVGAECGRVRRDRRAGACHRSAGIRVHRLEWRERQRIEPHRPLTAAPRRDRELDRREMLELPATLRPPREGDVAFLQRYGAPLLDPVHVHRVVPPHIVARRIDELRLEVLVRRLPANAIRQRVVLRHRDVELLPRDRVTAMPVEVEVEPHRVAVHPRAVGADRERDAVRGMGAPAARALEAVEQPRRARQRGHGHGSLRAHTRGARHGADCTNQPRQRAPHPFTLPAITPWM